MTKGNKGTKMENSEDKASEKELGATAKNEFAPNVIAGKEIAPAPSPEPSMQAEAGKDTPPRDEEREFLDYVHGFLKQEADRLGYDIALTKRNAARGPVMLYHRETREGKVFNAPEEAGPDFMSGDELQALQAEERAEG